MSGMPSEFKELIEKMVKRVDQLKTEGLLDTDKNPYRALNMKVLNDFVKNGVNSRCAVKEVDKQLALLSSVRASKPEYRERYFIWSTNIEVDQQEVGKRMNLEYFINKLLVDWSYLSKCFDLKPQ